MTPTERTSRPWVVFGMNRSGTTPVYNVVAHYAKTHLNHEPLGEYFNLAYEDAQELDGGIRMVRYQPKGFPEPEEAQRILLGRMDLLLKYWGRYSLKVTPMNFFPRHSNRVVHGSRWVLVERRDLFAAVLSWLISVTLDRWYQEQPTLEQEPLRVDLKNFHAFVDLWQTYQRMKGLLNDYDLVVYEDILRDGRVDPKKVYQALGLSETPENSMFVIHKQHLFDKRDAILNIAEVEAAYRKSPLQGVFPI